MSLSQRARDLSLWMTKFASVTGTKGEADFSAFLQSELSYFDEVWCRPIPGGAHRRQNVFALKKGKSKNCIVLTGHFDVVSIEGYGDLPAFDPEALLPLTIERLKLTGENSQALADFESGDFLPGRGLLDMKAGLAAGIAAIEAYQGDANLLFLAVADEENRSAGAIAAVPELLAAATAHELDIKLVINLDAISDQGDGQKARVVTFGSIGKQLLTAFVVGKEAHAGYPQDGVNAAYIAAELISEIELNAALAEETDDEIAASPSTLYAKDLKSGYNVTSPAQSFVYWNTMQHRRSALEVLEIAQELAQKALTRVATRASHKVKLMTYNELSEIAGSFEVKIDATLPLAEQSLLATQAVWKASGLSEPTVVLGFGSIPYKSVYLQDADLRKKIAQALLPFDIGTLHYFAGISDMSFFGEAVSNFATEQQNCPIWGSSFTLSSPAGFPTINLGPWGRDYHHWLERLHAPYAFDILPRALLAVIDAVV